MDFNANPVLRGECTQSELARRLTELVVKLPPVSPPRAKPRDTTSSLYRINIRKSRSLSSVPAKSEEDCSPWQHLPKNR